MRNPKTRMRVVRSVVALTAAAGAAFVAPAAAMAEPTDCTYRWSDAQRAGDAAVRCEQGTGRYRIAISCSYGLNDNLRYLYYGGWLSAGGGWSARGCPNDMYRRSFSKQVG
ncbi:hypothetical protein GCM10007977_017520 [Dactylosporangium sucinum]|uniref:Secreted protein n=1 Tax=Dactylosporangium sucinum TaxID=1424081 RepID=A0A917WN75_9ACTN|nr:hypothetical protein GCM10007977_017520 [Dactylosporangium sucinum]